MIEMKKAQQVTKAIRNVGKVLTLKMIAINKICGKLKVKRFRIPNASSASRYYLT